MAKRNRQPADETPQVPQPPSPGETERSDAAEFADVQPANRATQTRRIFLGWDRPALESAAEWLLQCADKPQQVPNHSVGPQAGGTARQGLFDLTQTLVVIPAARARRRLLQLLTLKAREKGAALLPPQIVTLGNFPEQLYDNSQPLADTATRLLTWLAAFQAIPLQERQLFLPSLTASDLLRELSFAQQLVELHRRLGMEVRSFRSVREHLEQNPQAGDLQRWEVLAKVQASYYERLSRRGLWDLQAARNVAIRKQLCRSDRNLVVVGAVDLSESNRQMLRLLGAQVTALIFAPQEWAEFFDSVGGLRAEQWQAAKLNIPSSRIRIVDRPADQAEEVLQALQELEGAYTADQITLGMPDDRLAPAVELALENWNVPYRRLEGRPFKTSSAVRFAGCLADYLERPEFSRFAQLVRHPDLFQWLSVKLRRSDWLSQVDDFQAKYLASRLPLWEPLHWPQGRQVEKNPELVTVSEIQTALQELLQPFAGVETLPLATAAQRWRWVLQELYGEDAGDAIPLAGSTDWGDATESASEANAATTLIEAFAALERSVPGEQQLASTSPSAPFVHVSLREAFTLALALAPHRESGDPPNPEAVELVGWLDLPWDDAPVVVTTGMNEEAIGSQEPILPLLPATLIESLGISHPQQRHARNLYVLQLIVQTRKQVRLICGRRDGEGNPNLISRLLLAEEDDALVERVNAFFNFSGESVRRRWLWPKAGWSEQQTLMIPRPSDIPEVSRLSVTRFRDYIECPYRFYLSAVMHLEPVSDSLREMDGGAFGSLAHDVLEKFGRHPVRLSENSTEIFTFLERTLEQEAQRFQHQSWFAAVEVQVESLRERFRAFAEAQAAHRAEGWEIIAVEEAAEYHWPGLVKPFLIKGRIDRVDRHADGRLAVWDYKTSDTGKKVDKAHRDRDGNWIDLQLPLYRYLLENVAAVGSAEARRQRDQIQLGYVLLPRSTKDVGFNAATWEPAELADADALAQQVIERIQQQAFWPPRAEPPDFSEHFAAICQDHVFERSLIDG